MTYSYPLRCIENNQGLVAIPKKLQIILIFLQSIKRQICRFIFFQVYELKNKANKVKIVINSD